MTEESLYDVEPIDQKTLFLRTINFFITLEPIEVTLWGIKKPVLALLKPYQVKRSIRMRLCNEFSFSIDSSGLDAFLKGTLSSDVEHRDWGIIKNGMPLVLSRINDSTIFHFTEYLEARELDCFLKDLIEEGVVSKVQLIMDS